jgi:hypothetical protein
VPKYSPIEGEQWRCLPDAEGRYEVSDLGRVRSLVAGCRAGSVPRRQPLLMSPYDNGRGYLVINLKLSSGYECHGISELVLRAFVRPRPSATHHAAHGDGRPRDNRLQNLRWATPKENDRDKDRHGTRPLRPQRRVEGVEHFRCTRCDTWLPRDRFRPLPRSGTSRCGLSSWCRACENARSREAKRRRRAAARRTPSESHLLPPRTRTRPIL